MAEPAVKNFFTPGWSGRTAKILRRVMNGEPISLIATEYGLTERDVTGFVLTAIRTQGQRAYRKALRQDPQEFPADSRKRTQALLAQLMSELRHEPVSTSWKARIELGKGFGLLRTNTGDTNIGTQNNILVYVTSDEDAQRLIELGKQAASLPEGNPNRAITVSATADTEPDHAGENLVATDLHKNI